MYVCMDTLVGGCVCACFPICMGTQDKWEIHGMLWFPIQFSSVQFTQSCPTLCDPMNHSTPGLLFITISRSSLRLKPIESMMPCSHLILCRPLLLLPPISPSIWVFSNESILCILKSRDITLLTKVHLVKAMVFPVVVYGCVRP